MLLPHRRLFSHIFFFFGAWWCCCWAVANSNAFESCIRSIYVCMHPSQWEKRRANISELRNAWNPINGETLLELEIHITQTHTNNRAFFYLKYRSQAKQISFKENILLSMPLQAIRSKIEKTYTQIKPRTIQMAQALYNSIAEKKRSSFQHKTFISPLMKTASAFSASIHRSKTKRTKACSELEMEQAKRM